MTRTRRSVLKGAFGVATVGSLAGCLDGLEELVDLEPDEGSGYAAFFTLENWCEEIAGNVFEFENPVPVGDMGHGWSPDGDIVRDVATSSVFVYLDTPEFTWAQDVASQLRADHEEVAVIDGLEGFGDDRLLVVGRDSTPEPDRDHDWDPHAVEVGEFDVIDGNTGEVTAYWHVNHWHGELPEVPVDGDVTLGAVVEDDAQRVLPLGSNDPFQLDARLADAAPDGLVEIESRGDHVRLHGLETGRTLLVFQLVHDGEVLWETDAQAIDVEVVEEVDDAAADEFYDPHVWVDPVLAKDVVDNLVEGLSETVPREADTFEENAAAYKEQLDDVHQQFEALEADAELDVAILAAHDAFAYLEHRYGFELHTPVGISPNDSPSPSEIADTVELVDDLGIDTILYDPFETPGSEEIPPLAETIVENSTATEVAPLTPAEGTTSEWADDGWGWIEQMEEINIPSLRSALKAD